MILLGLLVGWCCSWLRLLLGRVWWLLFGLVVLAWLVVGGFGYSGCVGAWYWVVVGGGGLGCNWLRVEASDWL